MSRKMLSVAILSSAMIVPFAGAVGCSDTVSEEKTVKVKDNGTVVRKQETVKENADGSVTKTEKKTVDKVD